MKKLMSLIILLMFISTSTLAATSPELMLAIDKVFNADFEAAKAIVTPYIVAHPEDSDGYILRGMTREWYQYLTNKKESLNPQIMEDYQKARSLAEAALQKSPDSVELKMRLANAYVYVSKKQLDMGHKMQAGSTLKQAKNLMLEVLAKDPNNPDVYFALGLFNYFSANVPSGFKWLASLLGFKGDGKLGKEYIIKATTVPNLTQMDAFYMLYYIYAKKERDWASALIYTQQLTDRYPNNLAFLTRNSEMLFLTKRVADARIGFSTFIDRCNALGDACDQRSAFWTYYFMTRSYMEEGNLEKAKEYHGKAFGLDTHESKGATASLEKWKTQLGK